MIPAPRRKHPLRCVIPRRLLRMNPQRQACTGGALFNVTLGLLPLRPRRCARLPSSPRAIEMNTRGKHGYLDARQQRFIIASYVLLVAATALARLPGLNPASLWWDDLWVATLAKASLREALTIPAPTPAGFLLTLWLVRRL